MTEIRSVSSRNGSMAGASSVFMTSSPGSPNWLDWLRFASAVRGYGRRSVIDDSTDEVGSILLERSKRSAVRLLCRQVRG